MCMACDAIRLRAVLRACIAARRPGALLATRVLPPPGQGDTRCQAAVCHKPLNQAPAPQHPPAWTAPPPPRPHSLQVGCSEYISEPSTPPRYCRGWYGVTCCADPAAPRVMSSLLLSPQCLFAHAPANMTIRLNRINGSISDPAVWRPLLTLHECGMRVLNLESNKISGKIGPTVGAHRRPPPRRPAPGRAATLNSRPILRLLACKCLPAPPCPRPSRSGAA